jgi:hypothetical protein
VTPAGGFFGLISDAAITSFIIRNGEFSPGERDRFFVDDFRASAVPEPALIALLGGGVAGAAIRRRRRRA